MTPTGTPMEGPAAARPELDGHGDARVRYLGLTLLAERVLAEGGSDQLALLLPESVEGPPERTPEEMLVLAGLYARLGPYLGARRRPSWRVADHLPVRVRIAWLRAVRDVTATDAHRCAPARALPR